MSERSYYSASTFMPDGVLPEGITWTEVEGKPALKLNHTILDVTNVAEKLLKTQTGGGLQNDFDSSINPCPPPFPLSHYCADNELKFKTKDGKIEIGGKSFPREEVQNAINTGVNAYNVDNQRYVKGASIVSVPDVQPLPSTPTAISKDAVPAAAIDGSRINIQIPTTDSNYSPNLLGLGIGVVVGIAGLSMGINSLWKRWKNWREEMRLEESNEKADEIIRDQNRREKQINARKRVKPGAFLSHTSPNEINTVKEEVKAGTPLYNQLGEIAWAAEEQAARSEEADQSQKVVDPANDKIWGWKVKEVEGEKYAVPLHTPTKITPWSTEGLVKFFASRSTLLTILLSNRSSGEPKANRERYKEKPGHGKVLRPR